MAQTVTAWLAALAVAAAPAPRAEPPPTPPAPTVLFDLATLAGTAESTWAALTYDRKHDELFAVYGGLVRVFNRAGMETFVFGGDGDLGQIERVAVLDDGDLLLLTQLKGRRQILRTDYRGEPLGAFEATDLPRALEGFNPDRIVVQGGKVHLVESATMRVVVTDAKGTPERVEDLARLVRKADDGIRIGLQGFWVDGQGNWYFTMPYAFTAFVRSPTGGLRQFGTRGSSPGKFNIVGSVATDEEGNVFVLDRLRSVVMIFDPDLGFALEFGYRGDGPSNLIAPFDLAVGNGKVFVSQARDRGVKVFQHDATTRAISARRPAGGGAP